MQKIEVAACYEQLEKVANAGFSSRSPSNQDDFGDEQTIGLCLKRRGKNIFQGDPDDSFGLFLGLDDNNRYIVGINKLGSKFAFVSGEAYESLADLKIDWVLD